MAATKSQPATKTPPATTGGGDAVLRHFDVVWDCPLGSARIDWEATDEEQVKREFLDHCARGLTITPK